MTPTQYQKTVRKLIGMEQGQIEKRQLIEMLQQYNKLIKNLAHDCGIDISDDIPKSTKKSKAKQKNWNLWSRNELLTFAHSAWAMCDEPEGEYVDDDDDDDDDDDWY